jgi:hypothetical protein
MAERRNGNRMVEWWNGRNGNRMAEIVELRRKVWQNGRMAEMATYVLFTVHTNDDDTDDDDTLIFYSIE